MLRTESDECCRPRKFMEKLERHLIEHTPSDKVRVIQIGTFFSFCF